MRCGFKKTEEFKVAKLRVPNEEKGDGKMIDLFLGFALVSTDDGVTREIKRSRSKSA